MSFATRGSPRSWVLLLAIRALAVLALVTFAGTFLWHDLTTPLSLPGEVLISVESGDGLGPIASRLQRQGALRHTWPLLAFARWKGLDRSVRSGDFRFQGTLTPLQVLDILRGPPNALVRVTIPEGTTLHGVARLLEAAGLLPGEELLRAAQDPELQRELDLPGSGFEGYLFPDTYEWPRRSTAMTILRRMVARFRDVVTPMTTRLRERGWSQHQWVTLASLIERETALANERRLVAAVFQNRLRLGMRLQSDPTAMYGRAEGEVPEAADLLVDTPYNTYLHAGLPPGPICNPGRAALEAALDPASVPYLYFVARGDGGHEFSTKLEDHNRAVDRYRQIRRGQRAAKVR